MLLLLLWIVLLHKLLLGLLVHARCIWSGTPAHVISLVLLLLLHLHWLSLKLIAACVEWLETLEL